MGSSELNIYVFKLTLLTMLILAGLMGTIYGLEYYATHKPQQTVRAADYADATKVSGRKVSSSVFVYAPQNTRFSVQLGSKPEYSDPVIAGGSWEGTISRNGMSIGYSTYDYLYYENTGVDFTEPAQGWIVNKDKLDSYAEFVSKVLGLRDNERIRLSQELRAAAENVSTQSLFVGLVSGAELSSRIPVQTSLTRNVVRYQFFVRGARTGEQVAPPVLAPIPRLEPLIIELGVSAL